MLITQTGGTAELSDIATIADQTLLLNVSGGAASPIAGTRTQALALLSGGAAASDVAPTTGLLKSQDAYAQATVNTTGAALRLAGGIGRRLVTVVDYTLIDAATDTITVTPNGTATVGTEGTAWTAATSNAATATSIASWINGLANVSAVAVGDSVYVTPDSTCYSLTLATSMAAGEGTVTSGADGAVLHPDGSVAAPSISFINQSNMGFYRSADSVTTWGVNSASWISMSPAAMRFRDTTIVSWSSTSASTGTSDLGLGRLAAASLRQGLAPSATPISQTFTIGEASRPGTDTDTGGASGTITSGLGTRAGARKAVFIEAKINEATDFIELKDDEHELLLQAVNGFSWITQAAKIMERAGWFEAIEKATPEKPEAKLKIVTNSKEE